MIRPLLALPWIFLLSSACAQPSLTLQPLSVMATPVNGLALFDEGKGGLAGMFEQTCDFDLRSGAIGQDFDSGPGLEYLLDAIGDQGISLLDGSLWMVRPGSAEALEGSPLGGHDIVHARLFEDLSTLRLSGTDSQCLATHADELGVELSAWELPESACALSNRLLVDAHSQRSWVGTKTGLYQVSPAGMEKITASSAQLSAWDPLIGQLYSAEALGDRLEAFTPQGARLWETRLDGRILDVVALPEPSALLVALESDNKTRLLALSPEDASVVGLRDLGSVQLTGLRADRFGSHIALIEPQRVQFFQAHVD
jgi:hypothetical protein